MKNKSLSIIIVSFNTKDLLINLLKYLKKAINKAEKKGYFIETIVVDNNSQDGTVFEVKKRFHWVKLIVNQKNLGFSLASNKGILKAKGNFILLLNSDTQVFSDTLVSCLDYLFLKPKIDALTCRVELPDGNIDPASHRGFPTPWNAFCYFTGLEKIFPKSYLFGGYHQGWKNINEPHEIDSCSGAFIIVRKKVINKIGVLDDRFFMYGEDLDWCYRMKKNGFSLWYYPKTKIIHFKGKSGIKKICDKKTNLDTKKYFYKTMKLFYDKHYKKKYPKIIYTLVLIGIWLISKIRS